MEKAESDQSNDLHLQARERLKEDEGIPALFRTLNDGDSALSPVHDLQTRLIDLEMQNIELKRAKVETEKALIKYSNLYDFAPTGLFTLDASGLILEVNLTGANLLGMERYKLFKKRFELFVVPKDRHELVAFIRKAFDTGIKQTCELRLIRVEGSAVYVRIEGIITDENQQNKRQLRLDIIDITERKLAEEALCQSEKNYRQLVERANSVILRMDTFGVTTFINEFALKFFGYDERDILGKNLVGTILPELESNERDLKKMIVGFRLNPDRCISNISENICRNGRRVWISWTCKSIRDKNGRVAEVLCIGNDITTQKNADKQLAELNHCFLSFGTDPVENINSLVALCGKQLGATCALYNRLQDEKLCSVGQWNTPSDFISVDSPDGHVCYDLIRSGENKVKLIRDLPHTVYSKTDPNVLRYHLKTYLGSTVSFGGVCVGSLCVVFQDDHVPSEEDKRFLEIVASAVGIEENRMQAEEALKKSERSYRLLAQNSTDVIWTMDLNNKFLYISPSNALMTGFSNEEAMSFTLEEILTPNSFRRVTQILAEELESERMHQKDLSKLRTIEVEERCKDGSIIFVEIKATFLRDAEGQPIGIQGVSRDITERKRAEEKLRLANQQLHDIIEFLPDATFVVDDKKKVIAWNRAMEEMTGVLKEEIMGNGDYSYSTPFYGETRPLLIDLLDKSDVEIESKYVRVERKGRAIYAEASVPSLSDGQGAYIWATASLLFDGEGNRIGAIESIRDITERRRAEEELKSAKEAAETATKAKSEFLANMSHEIRTPMNAIMGLTGLLLEEDLTLDQKDDVQTIRKSGESLLTIINDILDLSKIEGGKIELEFQPFNLRKCIEESLELIAANFCEKGIELKYTINDATPEYLMGDASRLRQILVNLLNNAVKFTEKGDVEVSVVGRSLGDGKHELHFAVKDSGIGIPENKIGSLFHPFSQIDNSTTRKYGGTGLGLVICKRLAETMGGRIWAESKFGTGSTFHFTIMTKDILCKPFNERPGSLLKVELSNKRDNNLRILLAEDNIINQKVMYRMLKKLGYRAEVAADGLEVLKALKDSPYDVILMDVQMPKMDGFEATRFIRQAWPDGPKIIAITAHALKGDKEKCLEAGMDEYISKPVNMIELQKALELCNRMP